MFQVLFHISNLLQLLNNQLCPDYSVALFEKANKRQLKMVILNY